MTKEMLMLKYVKLVPWHHSVFEEAVDAAGMDWHSDRLWDLYAEWEKEQGNLKAMTVVYDRALRMPTQLYRGHLDK